MMYFECDVFPYTLPVRPPRGFAMQHLPVRQAGLTFNIIRNGRRHREKVKTEIWKKVSTFLQSFLSTITKNQPREKAAPLALLFRVRL